MRKGRAAVVLCLIAAIVISCLSGVGYAAGNMTVFTLSGSAERVMPGQSLEVTLNATNLKGLYAYEALISFDPDRVELDKAESKLEGYFIPPKAVNGNLTLAFTKVGKKSGEQGNMALSTLTFKGKAQGDAKIKLVSVKALDPELTATTYHYGTAFDDLDGYEWARLEIEALSSLDIIKGTSAATFGPGNTITRADFISLLVRAFKLHAEIGENFTDVEPSDYFYHEVGVAKKLGIVKGTGGNYFDPRMGISRQDMMVAAARAMKLAGAMPDESASDLSGYHDSDEVAAYAVSPMAQLVKKGIIQGYNGRIRPRDTAIRAEAAVIIFKLLMNSNPGHSEMKAEVVL